MRASLVLVLAVALPALAADPKATPTPEQQANNAVVGGVAADAQKRGLTVVEQGPAQDLDGDGKNEVAAACKNEDGGLIVAIWRVMPGNRVQHIWQSPTLNADELKSLQLRNMVGDKRAEVVLEAIEHSPDETRRLLKVYRADESGIREILALSHEEKGEKETVLDRISYGDDEPGYRISDLEGDGNQEVMIRREPKAIKAKGSRGASITLVTGVRESVFAWDGKPKNGMYVPRQDRSVNFIPAYKVTRVTASSQKLPDDLMKAEQDRALEASLNQAMDSEGAVDAGPLNDDPTPVEANPAPRAFWVADNKLETSWVENAKGPGDGEWVTVELGDRKDIRMVRVVPVCAEDEADAKSHNELTAFTFLLSGAQRINIDRSEKEPGDANVLAVLEVPVPDKKFAPQVLVFLQKGIKSSSVRVVIDKAKKRGKGNDTCIAELSVH